MKKLQALIMFTTLMSLSCFAQDNIKMLNGDLLNVKIIKQNNNYILVKKDTSEYKIKTDDVENISYGYNLPTYIKANDTAQLTTLKNWNEDNPKPIFTKNELMEKAGGNLIGGGSCMLAGFVLAAIAPYTVTSKEIITNVTVPGTSPKQTIPIASKEYDYTPAYVCLGVAAGLELASMICFISAGSNLQQAANIPDKKLTYRLTPIGGGVCFRF